jgi:hypothetical protein
MLAETARNDSGYGKNQPTATNLCPTPTLLGD